ncbi:hypothetical protein NMY22_g19940 [Coprinellus aureogranulatus]|nr:hypothetical protein NMY22_g19940 [Coprinellus aureogranulatus]
MRGIIQRDDIEDEELDSAQLQEGMPTTIAGFKDHPLYVLTRHLKQTEVIHPPPPETPEIGKFRGEPVYPRSSVVALKSAETWMRTEGRVVRAGCQPLKTVKARPGTVNRLRELEVMKDELRDAGHSTENVEVTQGLYARSQTEVYTPPPVIDGKIPKNDFGNIDLYAPTMLPKGAVHLPYKGIAKIAKKLGFDYAEAVTGFEFRKRRANAVIEGIVIASENESAVLDAYWEHQQAEEEKARVKKEEKALQHWIKLVQGLRIRQRLQEEYADRGTPGKAESSKRGASKKARTKSKTEPVDGAVEGGSGDRENEDDEEVEHRHGEGHGGGFLVEADDVVQAFNLPKYNPLILESSSNPFASSSKLKLGVGGGKKNSKHLSTGAEEGRDGTEGHVEKGIAIDYETYDLDDPEDPPLSEGTMDVDVDMESAFAPDDAASVGEDEGPKTMQELLEADNRSKDTSRSPSRRRPGSADCTCTCDRDAQYQATLVRDTIWRLAGSAKEALELMRGQGGRSAQQAPATRGFGALGEVQRLRHALKNARSRESYAWRNLRSRPDLWDEERVQWYVRETATYVRLLDDAESDPEYAYYA